jgi:hypothetical protein
MFNWFNKPQKELDKVVDDLGVKINDIIAERDSLQRQVKDLRDKLVRIETDVRDEEFVLDFRQFRVFSIERNFHSDLPCTIVGYMVKDGDTETCREWYLYCTEKRHHEIVDAFKAYQLARDKSMYSNLI